MDVRVLIAWHPTDIYQACVVATDWPRGWTKLYYSKMDCVTELRSIDLLTPALADEVLESDFDIRDKILMIWSQTDPGTLEEVGFKERTRERLN